MSQLTWRLLSLVLLVASLVGLVVVIVLHTATGGHVPFDYGIVLDAGSSHTKVTLYKWMGDQINNTGLVHEVTQCGTIYGIDDNEEQVSETLVDLMACIAQVTGAIDFDREGSTPTFLGATAGMRLLRLKNSTVADFIFASIEKSLAEFRDHDKRLDVRQVRTLSGTEEGFFAWIAANFLLLNLPPRPAPLQSSSSALPLNRTVGILDMGGASAQIAYETEPEMFEGATVSTTLYGHDYRVRASSNLCWGREEALHRYLALLIMDSKEDEAKIINDPCLYEGANRTVSGKNLAGRLCIQSLDEARQAFDVLKSYQFTGLPNQIKCNQIITRMLDLSECQKSFQTCFTQEKESPPNDMIFYAISTYYYSSLAFPIVNASTTLADYVRGTETFCQKKWADIVAAGIHKPKYALDYCFQLTYIKHTLSDVYRFAEGQWPNIRFVKTINKQSMGWSLGLMINASNAIQPLEANPPVVEVPGLVCLILVGALCALFAIYILLKCRSV